jgi:hypothetical protein
MRQRCLTLLLALVAWIVVPGAPRIVHATTGTPSCLAATAGTSPGALERTSDHSDRRARPEQRHDATTATRFAALAAVGVDIDAVQLDRDDDLVATQRSSALPRGPPVA